MEKFQLFFITVSLVHFFSAFSAVLHIALLTNDCISANPYHVLLSFVSFLTFLNLLVNQWFTVLKTLRWHFNKCKAWINIISVRMGLLFCVLNLFIYWNYSTKRFFKIYPGTDQYPCVLFWWNDMWCVGKNMLLLPTCTWAFELHCTENLKCCTSGACFNISLLIGLLINLSSNIFGPSIVKYCRPTEPKDQCETASFD